MTKLDILDDIRVASPCQVSWEAMKGDERVRLCDQCRMNVYDISKMTRDDALTFINEREGRLCVRFHRRKDGTVLTSDCPVGRRSRLRRMAAAVLAGFAFTVLAGFSFAFFGVWARARAQSNTYDRTCESDEGWAGFQWSAPPSGPEVEFQDYMKWAKECVGVERRHVIYTGALMDGPIR